MSTKKAAAESPEQIMENLRALIVEAEKTIGAGISDDAEGKLAALSERLSETREQVEHVLSVAKQKVVTGARKTDEVIRSHPYESLAIALGVGVLLGALLRRSK